jgi:hypothetical protein
MYSIEHEDERIEVEAQRMARVAYALKTDVIVTAANDRRAS